MPFVNKDKRVNFAPISTRKRGLAPIDYWISQEKCKKFDFFQQLKNVRNLTFLINEKKSQEKKGNSILETAHFNDKKTKK